MAEDVGVQIGPCSCGGYGIVYSAEAQDELGLPCHESASAAHQRESMPQKQIRRWVRETRERRWFGPTFRVYGVHAVLMDGGCPLHPNPEPDTPLGRMAYGLGWTGCSCVGAWQVDVGWAWGFTHWVAVFGTEFPMRRLVARRRP